MTNVAPGAHWQRDELVTSFLDRREALLPLIDVQEDVVRRLIERHQRPIESFLDLGAGDGAMSALVFAVSPEARGVLVDNSEPMLRRAGERFAGTPPDWEPLRADLGTPAWRDHLPADRYALVVSALAIHHLPSVRKRQLYREILELLEPGGLFVNMDYVTALGPLHGLFDEQMRANALAHERARGGTGEAEEVDLEDDHDLPDTLQDQLAWLSEAGFAEPETHFKWAEAAVFGGIRPERGS
jgi:tRNA (cmo5U34)-methyltransferase